MTSSPHRRSLLVGATLVTLGLLLTACRPLAAPVVDAVHPSPVSTNPEDRTPHVLDGRVHAVIDLGDRVIVGGEFTQVKAFNKPAVFARRGLFAYTRATGAIETGFVPDLDRGGVRDMAVAPDGKLIIGGSFASVGGHVSPGLAKVDGYTGAPITGFRGATDGWVLTMALRGDRLLVGGAFSKVARQPRTNLAAVSATTGAIDPVLADLPVTTALRGTTNVNQLDATTDGTRLVITGNFSRVAGVLREQVAVIGLTASGAWLTDWSTRAYRGGVCASGYDYYLKDVDIAPDGAWFALVTTGAWRGLATMCDTVSRWELHRSGPDLQPTWTDHTGGDSLSAVVITGAAVYAAGHQRWANNENTPGGDRAGPGSVERPGIAAYHPATGDVLPWAIDRERGLQVGTLTATPDGLWIGSDSSRLGNEWHPRVAFLPL